MLPGVLPGPLPAIIDFRLPPTLSTQSSTFHFQVRSDLHQSSKNGRMFILGMGFVGQFFGSDLKNKGWLVSGTCTSMAKKKKLDEMGIDAYVFHSKDPNLEILDIIKNHTHLLVSIPTVLDAGDPLLLQHKDLLRSRLKNSSLKWFSYLSSTSVYGDSGGALVNEDHPLNPSSELGRSRLAAEKGWLELGHDLDLAVQVFRLGGIYGPGRSAIDTMLKPESLSKKQRLRSSKRFISRIHVADICQALTASIHKPSSGRIYNIVDDDPAPREVVFRFAQNLINKKWPDQEELKCSAPETEESQLLSGLVEHMEEKRVCNTRMKQELGVELLYPSYQSGLLHIVQHLDNPFK